MLKELKEEWNVTHEMSIEGVEIVTAVHHTGIDHAHHDAGQDQGLVTAVAVVALVHYVVVLPALNVAVVANIHDLNQSLFQSPDQSPDQNLGKNLDQNQRVHQDLVVALLVHLAMELHVNLLGHHNHALPPLNNTKNNAHAPVLVVVPVIIKMNNSFSIN